MPTILFKLMGVFDDIGERRIIVDSDLTIAEVKKLVKKEFKIVPNAIITFIHNGKRITEDDIPFKRIPIDPRKEKISVLVSNPYTT